MKAASFRPIPMVPGGLALRGSGSVLGQDDVAQIQEGVISNYENEVGVLEALAQNLPPTPRLRAGEIAARCRSRLSDLKWVAEFTPDQEFAWNSTADEVQACVAELAAYIGAQIDAMEEEEAQPPVEPERETPPILPQPAAAKEEIMGLDPTVFWVGTSIVGIGLVAGLMALAKAK
jgi:hypothetical protein